MHVALPCDSEVPWGYKRIAAQNDVPADLLFAIAQVESGIKRHSGKILPWPWALNIEGNSHFFKTKFAAIQKAKTAANQGKHSIDVGLMQVNWRFHSRRFKDLESAFDPYTNLEAGAGVLHDCYKRTLDWLQATACYHSPSNRIRGKRYRNKVETILRSLSRSSLREAGEFPPEES